MDIGQEFEGQTVTDAVARAAQSLGCAPGMVRYEVIDEGRAGFLGLGRRPARIRVRERDDAGASRGARPAQPRAGGGLGESARPGPRQGGDVAGRGRSGEPAGDGEREGRRRRRRKRGGRRGDGAQDGSREVAGDSGPGGRSDAGADRHGGDRSGGNARQDGRRDGRRDDRRDGRADAGRGAVRMREGPRGGGGQTDRGNRQPGRDGQPRGGDGQGGEGHHAGGAARREDRGERHGSGAGRPGQQDGRFQHGVRRGSAGMSGGSARSGHAGGRDRGRGEDRGRGREREGSGDPAGTTHAPRPFQPFPPGVPYSRQEIVRQVAGTILQLMHLDLRARLREREEAIVLELSGEDAALLGEDGGETIEALQHVVNKIVSRDERFGMRVVVDCEGYRSRQDEQIAERARRAADEAIASGQPVHLDGLNPYERRIVHVELSGREGVHTHSTGEGSIKKLTIEPVAGGPSREEV